MHKWSIHVQDIKEKAKMQPLQAMLTGPVTGSREDTKEVARYRGVTLVKRSGKYRALVWHEKERHVVEGCFETPEEAAHAHDILAVQLKGG